MAPTKTKAKPEKLYSKESCPECGVDVWREKGKDKTPTCGSCGTQFNALFP